MVPTGEIGVSVADSLLTITPGAAEMLLALRAEEEDADDLVLRIEVTGIDGAQYAYEVYFEARSELGADDVVFETAGLPVAVPAEDSDKVRGATLERGAAGFSLANPNRPPGAPPPGMEAPTLDDVPTGDMDTELAALVDGFLEAEINPAIASHGGMARLVGLEAGIAYLQLAGGCQGCGMAAVTLEQGIKQALLGALPEIDDVVDVTDHASGSNPYYAGSKK